MIVDIGFSDTCGMSVVKYISKLNIKLNFEEASARLIVLYSADFANRMVIDCYEDAKNQFVDLDIQGADWVNALRLADVSVLSPLSSYNKSMQIASCE